MATAGLPAAHSNEQSNTVEPAEAGTDPLADEIVMAREEQTTAAPSRDGQSSDAASSDDSSTDSSHDSSADQPIPQESAQTSSPAAPAAAPPADHVPSPLPAPAAQDSSVNAAEAAAPSEIAPSEHPDSRPPAPSQAATSAPTPTDDTLPTKDVTQPMAADASTSEKTVVPLEVAEPVQVAATPAREGRVSLVLRINKELIRLCVDLQAKELTGDPLYREISVRLQGNLGYLASIADKNGTRPQQSAPPKLEPFPHTLHAPDSSLPALYDKLIAFFQQSSSSSASPTASLDARKRSRDVSTDAEEARKRIPTLDGASKGTNGDPSAASAQPQPSHGPNFASAPPVPIASPQQTPPNNAQTQALIQTFGPNALANLHALQVHMRGQGKHPWIAFMESNVPNFSSLPLQVQMQQLTAMQVSAQQYQQKAQALQAATGIGSPAQMLNGTSPYPQLGHSSASPAGASGVRNASSSSSTSSPRGSMTATHNAFAPTSATRPSSSGSIGSASGRPRTASQLDFDPTSTSTLDADSGNSQQQNPNSMGINLQNLPPHVQQQLRQQYFAQMQAAQQQQQQQASHEAQSGPSWNFQS